MRKEKKFLIFLVLSIFGAGCHTGKAAERKRLKQENVKTMISVAGGLSGRPVSAEELENLNKQISYNQEVQKAVESLGNTLENKPLVIKYCPVDGKRFSSQLEICPEHRVPLKILKK